MSDLLSTDMTWGEARAAINAAVEPTDFFGYIPGRTYWGWRGAIGSGGTISSGTWRLHPCIIRKTVRISHLVTRVITTASANGLLSIWASDPATLRPTGPALAYSASYFGAGTAMPIQSALNATVELAPGLYWVGVVMDASGVGFNTYTGVGTMLGEIYGGGASDMTTVTHLMALVPISYPPPDMTSQTITTGTSVGFAAIGFTVATT